MNYYIDITLIQDAEANLGFLWEKVYQQVHLALVENKTEENTSQIGLSIPEYGSSMFPLGSKMRLFSSNEQLLRQLDIGKWLNRLTDYVHFTSVRAVPGSVEQFAVFKRIRFDGNAERLARRRAKRKGESFEQALKHYEGYKQPQTDLPFINLKSLSDGQWFKLFIKKELVDSSELGTFSCYGLSQRATVPWF